MAAPPGRDDLEAERLQARSDADATLASKTARVEEEAASALVQKELQFHRSYNDRRYESGRSNLTYRQQSRRRGAWLDSIQQSRVAIPKEKENRLKQLTRARDASYREADETFKRKLRKTERFLARSGTDAEEEAKEANAVFQEEVAVWQKKREKRLELQKQAEQNASQIPWVYEHYRHLSPLVRQPMARKSNAVRLQSQLLQEHREQQAIRAKRDAALNAADPSPQDRYAREVERATQVAAHAKEEAEAAYRVAVTSYYVSKADAESVGRSFRTAETVAIHRAMDVRDAHQNAAEAAFDAAIQAAKKARNGESVP